MEHGILSQIWPQIILPILRLTFFISLGLFIASFIENLNWTHRLAAFARPLIRLGRLSAITGASFSVAFFSGVTANTMLAEAYEKGQMTRKELVLANLFNSLPRFFLHLPTVFFLTAPLIKAAAVIYVAITFLAAILQTVFVVLAGRLLLDGETFSSQPDISSHQSQKQRARLTWRQAAQKSIRRLRKRILKILKFMIPVYILFFLLNRYGLFTHLEELIARQAWFLSWLNPQSIGIVVLHVTTEFSAGLTAASVLLADNSLSYKEVVMALLVGNILAAPIRAIRHQLPYYTGIFTPALAVELVGVSQLTRAICIIIVASLYFFIF